MVSSTTGSSTNSNDVYADPSTKNTFTLQNAKDMQKPTEKVLCTLADNTYIRFGEYSVIDHDSKTQLLYVSEDMNKMQDAYAR